MDLTNYNSLNNSVDKGEEDKILKEGLEHSFYIANFAFIIYLISLNFNLIVHKGIHFLFILISLGIIDNNIVYYYKAYIHIEKFNVGGVNKALVFKITLAFFLALGVIMFVVGLFNILAIHNLMSNNSESADKAVLVAHTVLFSLSIIMLAHKRDLGYILITFVFQLGIVINGKQQDIKDSNILLIFTILTGVSIIFMAIFVGSRPQEEDRNMKDIKELQIDYAEHKHHNSL